MPSPSSPMACPADGTTLVMSERAGIEIDYCPQCRGVWLDRGELDKIIERSETAAAPQPASPQPGYPPQQGYPRDYGRDHGRQGHPKRRKSFLEELFD
jgi:Zn-finger nucleic acid-binding protein